MMTKNELCDGCGWHEVGSAHLGWCPILSIPALDKRLQRIEYWMEHGELPSEEPDYRPLVKWVLNAGQCRHGDECPGRARDEDCECGLADALNAAGIE